MWTQSPIRRASRMDRIDCGACFMAGLPGTTLDEGTQSLIGEFGVNHFILFSRNIEGEAQVRRLCRDIVACCREHHRQEPLIAIDQEGGTVQRLKPPFPQFADARSYGTSDQPEEALRRYSQENGALLAGLGINVNFAPVLDVCPVGRDCFMEHRCLHDDPEEVARLGALVIAGFQKLGVAACGKHFPGLGEAVIDPHLHLPRLDDDLAKIRSLDLIPFRRAIAAGVGLMMTSHVQYDGIDPDHLATMSSILLKDLLRDELGFNGVVVTDDLEMGAVKNHFGVAEAAVLSFAAGADLLLICEDQGYVRQGVELLLARCQGDGALAMRLHEARGRIKKLSACFGREHD